MCMVNMGRLPKNRIHKSFPLDDNILKTRHRHADTKYRSNMQYLYSKLKEMSKGGVKKDCLLSVTLLSIQSLESEITQKVGSEEMKGYQDDFVNFLLHEEALWKIKDTVKWWRKVEEALTSKDFIDSEKTDFIDSSCARRTSRTCNEFYARRSKSKEKLLAQASDFSESNCYSQFSENLFVPCAEEPDSLLSYEEQNCLANEILAEPMKFENSLF